MADDASPRPPTPTPAPGPRGEQAARLLEEAVPPASGGPPRTVPSVESLAPRFPDLEILEVLGAGGMGVVYRARHRRLDRLVALKILPESLGQDPAFAERFAREARTLARLDHPHVVRVHDFGQADGLYHLVLEYVDGANLRQVMAAGRLSPAEALAIVPQICEALQYAHDHGVVHRDIKPENILLDRRGQVKIADFGLAKLVGGPDGSPSLTGTGQVMGTVQYMAPEQYRTPQDVDHRADLFSLGVVFYEMLTGELPVGRFRAPSESGDLDARLDRIVMRALERERALRYQRAEEMRTDVSEIGQGPAPGEATRAPAAAAPPRDTSPARPDGPSGWVPALLSGVAIPAGFGLLGLVHAFWGSVDRGTPEAFLREAWKAAAAGGIFLAGLVLGVVAAARGARAPAPRRLHKAGVTLACLNLAMIPLLASIAAQEIAIHSFERDFATQRAARARVYPDEAARPWVRGAPEGVDPGSLLADVQSAWATFALWTRDPAWGFDAAVRRYTEADAEHLGRLEAPARERGIVERALGLAVLPVSALGGAVEEFRVAGIDARAHPRVEVTVRKTSPPYRTWTFPMVRDPDGAWRFVLGPVSGGPY